MPRIQQVKTTFTAGEVSRSLLGRGDLRAYANGALTLRNVFIQPTGGVTRRSGLRYVDTVPGKGRLIAFEFSTEQTYLLVLTAAQLSVYAGDTLVTTLDAPWEENQITQIAWTQSADTLLLIHPDVPPKKLVRTSGGAFELQDWSFFNDGGKIRQPYYKFAPTQATITPSATTGSITLTSSVAIFENGHDDTIIRVGGRQVSVTSVDSPTVVSGTVIETLASTSATIDWDEQAFSAARGWPVAVAFHQDRLVIGGSRDLPNRLWLSKSGDLFNFDLGTGLDDEAIEFSILSDQVNAIRGIFSGRHLQVFTSGAEWMVTGDPLTPATVQIRRQTRVGSIVERYIAPVNVDGATLFAARNKEQIQEFLYTDLEQAYQTTDLALVSRHIVPVPADMDFDQKKRLLYLVREDGLFATLTIFRSEQVEAWTLHDTEGEALSVSVAGDNVYMLIKRGDIYTVELFDDTLNLDAALTGSSDTPHLTWSGLDHLNGKTVSIVGDGIVLADTVVTGGEVTLDSPASFVEIGLLYTHIIEPLPPSAVDGASGRAVRLIEAVYKIEETAAMRLDVGRGLRDVALRSFNGAPLLDTPPETVSGDIRIRAIGWQPGSDRPLWRIEQSIPLPFTLLSVTTELNVSD